MKIEVLVDIHPSNVGDEELRWEHVSKIIHKLFDHFKEKIKSAHSQKQRVIIF